MTILRKTLGMLGLAASLAAGMALLTATDAQAMHKPENNATRVLIITFDGIRVDGLQQANTPNIDALIKAGAASMQTRDVMPSVTLPNYTSILCGAGPEIHGVADNKWRFDNHTLEPVETDEDGYFPSVFKVLKDNVSDVKTAFYGNWRTLFLPYNIKAIDDSMYVANEYIPLYERAFEFISENRDKPTFTFLYTGHTDHMGHVHEWMSPEYIQSIEEGDAEIGRLVAKLKDAGLYNDMYIMFISDHGGVGKHHGGLSKEEMTVPWVIVGPGIKKGFTITEPNNTVNTASTVLRIFGVKQPLSWTGEVPESIFK